MSVAAFLFLPENRRCTFPFIIPGFLFDIHPATCRTSTIEHEMMKSERCRNTGFAAFTMPPAEPAELQSPSPS
jgi:hypothetical protein